ncbi:hypothetical protein CHS0354_011857 [Potamilus streckersoni]|uniref:Uncharacterized protein n=1 Tax=Potamilus streckersoni TaxID=2493646 RepID=A0AAE0WAD6_9BIVA|nr:hypothetical protein CHS0354_011857 [Potamilus streckersoni]
MQVEQVNMQTFDIFLAIASGKLRQVNSVVERYGATEERNYVGRTPLVHAVCEAKDDVRTHLVRIFIRSGCDINASDNKGRTALMYACMDPDKVDLVRILSRQKNCDPNIQDYDGCTAIMHAVAAGNVSAIRALLNTNATKKFTDLSIRNSNSLNVLDLCVKLQQAECCKVLVHEGNANTKTVKDRVALLKLLDDKSCAIKLTTPAFGRPQSKAYRRDSSSSNAALEENPHQYTNDRHAGRETPLSTLSRAESFCRSNSNIHRPLGDNKNSTSPLLGQKDVFAVTNTPRTLKRALTPINRTSPRQLGMPPEESGFGNRTRLPSIPSGKRLYLVTASKTLETDEC